MEVGIERDTDEDERDGDRGSERETEMRPREIGGCCGVFPG